MSVVVVFRYVGLVGELATKKLYAADKYLWWRVFPPVLSGSCVYSLKEAEK